jgi:membrane protease YdiL (CAAX protease family)
LVGWIKDHPIATYIIWFAVVGQAFALMPMAFPDISAQIFIVCSTLIGLLLPALVITRLVEGPEGYHRLWQSILKFRVASGWYALAILATPVVAVALTFAFFGAPDSGASLVQALIAGFVVQGLVVLVTANLWEEIGVMFLQLRWQERHGPMKAVLFTALFFTFQHLTLILDSGSAVLLFPIFLIAAIGFRSMMGWIFNRTGSLFIVGLTHAASNGATGGSGLFGDGFIGTMWPNDASATVMHLVASLIIGLGVLVATRGRLAKDGHHSEGPTTVPQAAMSTH